MDAKSVTLVDSWETWNSFRLLCEHHSQLSVALDILSTLPSTISLGRWFGESVRAAIIHTDFLLTNSHGFPCLSERHQRRATKTEGHRSLLTPPCKINMGRLPNTNKDKKERSCMHM
ncbi:hypothetical protein VNO77_33777 [Canavalia gladiata]|uniref:PRMT5 TIM barrel domain-containing protein n=1 Tax=Canavalia gladiata TaxID=3824 RepID=A0AAN9KD20_CANGL